MAGSFRIGSGGGRPKGYVRRAVLFNALALAVAALVLPAPAAADPLRLMVLGDSLAAGYGLPPEDGFTAQLERALAEQGHDVAVLNAGVSGDTSAGGLSRIDWALADDPDAAIVELGSNDGLRGLDPAKTKRNLAGILDRLKAGGIPVLLAGMKAPPNLGKEYAAEFNPIFRELAEAKDVALYPFFLEGVAARPELNQPDGIHPNAKGVAEIVDRILPHVKELLARAREE